MVDADIIDQPPRPQDKLIAKYELRDITGGAFFQLQWEAFSNTFRAQSDTVTLAFKVGSHDTLDTAGYLDTISLSTVEPTAAHKVSAPTLLMGGIHDSLVAIEDIRAMAQHMPAAELREYDCNHFQPYYPPLFEEFAEVQAQFLAARL